MLNQGMGQNGYHKLYYSSRDWKFYRGLLSLLITHSEPGPILDIGCGCGYLIECAMRWGLTCKGLEGASEAITMARERCPEIDIRQHLLSEAFPFLDQTFQTVVMNQVIEHLEPEVVETTLRESYRVLRPRGMLFIASPSKFNTYEKKADTTHINMYSPKELERLLLSKGFSDIMHMNSPLNFLGKNYLGIGLMTVLFKLTKWERLSATANCLAYRGVK
ncbi:MAG: class I SAM-dependent methyltransferase [Desulfobacteraceae bacterium]|nr:class I SAM-dependent methyltransferase [Desulfobacteraceae bacterium]